MTKIKNKIILSLASFYDKTTKILNSREALKKANPDIVINTINTGESARLEFNPEPVSDPLEISRKQAFKSYLYSKKIFNFSKTSNGCISQTRDYSREYFRI